MAEAEFSWSVQTHEHKERSTDWYWSWGVITAVAAAVAIYFGNTFLAAILILGVGSVLVLVARGPREHMIRIGKRGVTIDGSVYPWKSIHSFWIEHETSTPKLFLSTMGVLSPHFTLELSSERLANELRTFMGRYAKEEEQGPHLGEHVAQLLGL